MKRPAIILTLGIVLGLAITHMTVSGQPASAPPAPVGSVQQVPGPNKQLFQPVNVDPELIRKGMQARSEYEVLTRQIIARTKQLYTENSTIKKFQDNMKELQKRIDEILAADEKLTRLKTKYQSMSPKIPSGPRKELPVAFPPSTKKK